MVAPAPPSRKAALLGAVPLLSSLTPSQLEKLAASGVDRTFHRGETILRQGEKGIGLYLMLSGSADLRRSGVRVSSLSAGQFFGEAALLADEPRTAEIFATTEVNCFVLNRWDFWAAVGVDPQADRALFEATVQRLKSIHTELVE